MSEQLAVEQAEAQRKLDEELRIETTRARLAEIIAETKERQARLRVACFDNRVPDRCGREQCDGLVEWEGRETTCPLDGTPGCPWMEQRSLRMRRERLAALGIGEQYLHATVKQCAPTVRKQVSDYCKHIREYVVGEQRRNLLVMGGVGTGKTAIAALAAQAAMRDGLTVRYRYAPTLFDELHAGSDAVQMGCERCDLLIIDDFGVQYSAEWTTSRFDALVEARYAKRRPVVVTTNASWQQMLEVPMWARVVDRWRQDCIAVSTGTESRRGGAVE